MSDDRQIKLTIDPVGKTKIEAFGFSGCGCTDATKAIEQAIAGEAGVTRTEKPEFYEMASDGVEVEQSW